ncbi:MAG: hypothetical protein H7334_13765 [Ferruginibacter sp.]|nr:hypothetical protein [Ferruginibacter sp.]
MKHTLLFICFIGVLVAACKGQRLTVDNLLTAAASSKSKFDGYLLKNGYGITKKDQFGDTILSTYEYRPYHNKKDKALPTHPDSSTHFFCRSDVNGSSCITYQTSSLAEFTQLANQFKIEGFTSHKSIDSLVKSPLIFQHRDMRAIAYFKKDDIFKMYCIQVQKQQSVDSKNLRYADDLLAFTSQEYLEFYFGKENVKEDTYYFPDKESAKCTVLFYNTERQVVFIWQDQENSCTIRHLLFGGQQSLESLKDNDAFIAENKWRLKSGIRAGMTLVELRRLNKADFEFNGGRSANPGVLTADNTGNINFIKEKVTLGCMNCSDNKFLTTTKISADEALTDERILFVLSIELNP